MHERLGYITVFSRYLSVIGHGAGLFPVRRLRGLGWQQLRMLRYPDNYIYRWLFMPSQWTVRCIFAIVDPTQYSSRRCLPRLLLEADHGAASDVVGCSEVGVRICRVGLHRAISQLAPPAWHPLHDTLFQRQVIFDWLLQSHYWGRPGPGRFGHVAATTWTSQSYCIVPVGNMCSSQKMDKKSER